MNKSLRPKANPASKPCATEDSDNCHWDAKKQGNGKGRSFVTVNGKTTYLKTPVGKPLSMGKINPKIMKNAATKPVTNKEFLDSKKTPKKKKRLPTP